MAEDIKIHYVFHSVKFVLANGVELALTNGVLESKGLKGPFGLALTPDDEANWQLREVRATEDFSEVLANRTVVEALVEKANQLLMTINMWPFEQSEGGGARLSLNQKLAPPEEIHRLVTSFRMDLLDFPARDWANLWTLIEGRIEGDRFFMVQGFSKDEIKIAVEQLKGLFHADWVIARFRDELGAKDEIEFAAELPTYSESRYPAQLLARTALGAICVDPGWNYLIELGLSIHELQGFAQIEELKGQVVRSSGTQHHLCLAAELYRRGLLKSLEPLTGSGSSKSDLLTSVGENQYAIEVKERSSRNPLRQLKKQLAKKARQLAEHSRMATVFHVVLIEDGEFDKSLEDGFFGSLQELAFDMPNKISAVVAGRRFVDASGGRVKRDAEYRILNQNALVPSDEEDLKVLFKKNYESFEYPISPIGSYFGFSKESPN